MNKPVDLSLSILDISKIAMYEYWYDYVKPMYGKKAKILYMDTNRFRVYMKSEYISEDLAGDVKKRLDTSNNEIKGPLPIGEKQNRLDW